MTVILSLYYLAHSKAAKNMFWFLVGLFLIHFIISGVIIWGLEDTLDKWKQDIGIINSYVLILLGLGLIVYTLVPKKPKLKKEKVYPKYYGTLPFVMGIIAPFVDFPALVEYVFLAIQVNVLFDNTIYRIVANTGLNIVFHLPIMVFWFIAITENQEMITGIKDKLHKWATKIDSKQPYVNLSIGMILIAIGIFLQY
jgi:cytochrome c biogenesis protein CcdA